MKKYINSKNRDSLEKSGIAGAKIISEPLSCVICGMQYVKADNFSNKNSFGECRLCPDCLKDLSCSKNRKCSFCKREFKILDEAVKLYYMDKIFYFCCKKCYYQFVRLHHPVSGNEWDTKFSNLSEESKKIYYSRLRKIKRRIRVLISFFGENYHLQNIRHPYIWIRPKCD